MHIIKSETIANLYIQSSLYISQTFTIIKQFSCFYIIPLVAYNYFLLIMSVYGLACSRRLISKIPMTIIYHNNTKYGNNKFEILFTICFIHSIMSCSALLLPCTSNFTALPYWYERIEETESSMKFDCRVCMDKKKKHDTYNILYIFNVTMANYYLHNKCYARRRN